MHLWVLKIAAGVVLAAGATGVACGGDDDDPGEGPAVGDTATIVAERDPLSEDDLENLGTTEVPGYTRGEPRVNFGNLTVSYASDDPEAAGGSVTITPCDPFICWDLRGQVSEEQEDNLLSLLPSIHIENPDLIFEYGTVVLEDGKEGFFVYTRSYVEEGTSKATSNSYRVFYHDGANHITLFVNPPGSLSAENAEALAAQMDQAGGEAVAKEIFAAFAPQFGTN